MTTIKLRIAVAGTLALGCSRLYRRHRRVGLASGGGGVRKSGACSTGGTWKLKAKNDNGVLEVETEVDVTKVGQHWTGRLTDKGALVANGRAVTVAPSGSFTVNRNIPNLAGTDVIAFHAVNGAGADTCDGTLSI